MANRTPGRGSRPRVPAYSLHKARGLACCKINGRRIYLGKYGSPESREAYAKIVADVLSGQPVEKPAPAQQAGGEPGPPSMSVRALADRYLQHAAAYYRRDGRPTTELGLVENAARRFVELFGDVAANAVTPLNLTAFQEHLVSVGLARSGVNGSVSRVRRMYRWAGSLGLVPAATTHGLELVPGLKAGRSDARESIPILPVDDEIVEATLQHLGPVVKAMVQLQRLTGARPGEISGLRPCEVDRSGEVWVYRPASHKTQHHGRERVIFIGPKGQRVLEPFLRRDPETLCFQPRESEAIRLVERHERRSTPLSCGNRPGSAMKSAPVWRAGERYSASSYRQAIRRACRQAGVEPWNPNQLRHTAATEVRKHFGLEASQVVLGHATARTSEIYAEKNLAAGAAVAKEIG